MFKIVRQEAVWEDKKLTLETGKIARQASGAVMVGHGDTRILCTVTASHDPIKVDFLPLSVHYQEKAFSAGRFPGGFHKREGKPSDREVLISRLIDRALRPLFPSDFYHEIQVICTVLSFDPHVDAAAASILGASAALMVSGLPFKGPVAALRLGHEDGKFVCSSLASKEFNLVVAGTREGVVMVECAAQEKSEEFIVDALDFAQSALVPLIDCITEFASKAAKAPFIYDHQEHSRTLLKEKIENHGAPYWNELCSIKDRYHRRDRLAHVKKEIAHRLKEEGETEEGHFSSVFSKVWRNKIRHFILTEKKRLDGRSYDEVRSISCEVGFLPRAHGSALFTRGDTQAIVSVTLGGKEDAQLVDGLTGAYKDPFLLHYNFPSFAVGEIGKVGSPGRREVGHGKLAWHALRSVLSSNELPYTIRIVSDITESCGSSSMATVCGGSLALMDAGIAISHPVAGIAMGLVQESFGVALLSDISGLEDGIGDMDFKVAGTVNGVTAVQMDLKGQPLSREFMAQALDQACKGRLSILESMQTQSLDRSRDRLSSYAPVLSTVKIPVDKIRDLIGPGGKVIREICETTGSKIDIADDGTVSIFAQDAKSAESTTHRIKQITGGPAMGEVYDAMIVKIMDFGAFVALGFSPDVIVHVSEISSSHVEDINKVLSVGDKIKVKLIGLDPRGRGKLSIKQV